MKRSQSCRHGAPLALALVVAACPGTDTPSLSVSAGSLRVGAEATVNVSASVGAQPGTGAVELSASLGELGAASVPLVEGSGRTTLRCPRATPGCVAGATITLTARWNGPRGVVTELATVRVTDPAPTDGGADAGRPDAGTLDGGPDAGADAGPVEPIDPDGGLVFDGGTFLAGGPLLLGRLGEPRTLGFSPLTAGAPVSLGFNQLPEQTFQYAGRLLYVRRGFLHVWVEDFPDSGVPVVDAGDPDAGEVDGGEVDGGAPDAGDPDAGGLDAGAVDAGPFFGPFPLFDPEGNDLRVASCEGLFGAADSGYVRVALPTPGGGLWVGCSETASGPIELYRKGQRFVTLTSTALMPIAASEQFILAVEVPPDGGPPLPLVFSAAESAVAFPPPDARQYQQGAGRATAAGFDFLAYDPALDGCFVVSMDRRGVATELPLTLPLAVLPDSCLSARFNGSSDSVLAFGSVDGGAPDRVFEVPFTRSGAMPLDAGGPDAGRPDGGRPDGGRADGGVDAGRSDAGGPPPRFLAGPPSDFLADPPVLSIDLSQPAFIIPP
ncbi:MAG: hypothetical protein SFW67_25690 [Myxococcaceae bacterium]|nr:hypothetical protein [Myxococcaceae bacterium]